MNLTTTILHLLLVELVLFARSTWAADYPTGEWVAPVSVNVTCQSHQYRVGDHCCRLCPQNYTQVAPCRPPHQTQCRCVAARWREASSGRCLPCSDCAAGSGVLRPCTGQHNTVCHQCPPHTFSQLVPVGAGHVTGSAEVTRSDRQCVPCTECRADQVKIQNCTRTMDSVCMDETFRLLAKGRSSVISGGRIGGGAAGSGGGGTQLGTSDPSENSLGIETAVYCSVLASLVLALLVYSGVRCWRLRRHSPHKSTGTPHVYVRAVTSSSSAAAAIPTDSPTDSTEVRSGHSTIGLAVTAHPAAGSAAAVSAPPPEVTSLQPRPPLTGLLRDRLTCMSRQQRAQLQSALGSGSGNTQWRHLASLLGYNSETLDKIERSAKLQSANAACILIGDWSKRSDATVTSFVRALTMIGRVDLASLVDHQPINTLAINSLVNFV